MEQQLLFDALLQTLEHCDMLQLLLRSRHLGCSFIGCQECCKEMCILGDVKLEAVPANMEYIPLTI